MFADLNIFVYCFVIMIFAGIVQGATGFGFSLFMLPLMSIFIPIKELIPISVLCSIPINLLVLLDAKKEIRLKEINLMIVFGILTIPIGVYLLKVIDKNTLMAAIGTIIVITALARLYGLKAKIKNYKFSLALTGALSGILNGSVSLSGPPIILLFNNQSESKDSMRGNFSVYAVITNFFVVASMMHQSVMDSSDFFNSFLLYPAVVIGVFLGIAISKKISEKHFNLITLYLLCIVGLWSVIKAIFY